jgi:hypothetical protein
MGKQALKIACLLSLALLGLSLTTQRAVADDDDPPSRVARLAYIHGAVSFEPAGTDDWVSAVVNRPMTTGDKIWADNDSRAEMHIGSASIRVADNTGFSFLNLTDNVTQIRLSAGTLRVRVKRLGEDETFEVDTPNLAFSILRPGIYRINVNEAGDTTVIKIRGGEGEVTGGGAAYNMHAWQIGTFSGVDQINPDIDNYERDDDDFDRWCADRDRHEDLSISSRYVSPDVIGYQDLDDYGGWRRVDEYGMIWFPHTTIVGWAPYRYGHWAYIYPWGYTWVDDAPWGFAPFHYGRWVFVNGYWGWVPCPPPPPPGPAVVYVRPVYAPALVAWVGGAHFGVGVSVGWFPLGPREVFVPSYPVSRTYVNNVNISNTTVNTTVINNYYITRNNTTVINNNITNVHYVNQSVSGAVTATSQQAFTSAQPVSRNLVAVNAREVATASVNVTAPAVAPNRQAVIGSGAATKFTPPAAVVNRAVVAKTTPPPPPLTFARQQQAIQANGGKPPAISQFRQMQTTSTQPIHPNVKMASAVTTQNQQNGRSGQSQTSSGNTGGQPNNNGGFKPFDNNNNQGNRGGNLQTSNGNGGNATANGNTNSNPNGNRSGNFGNNTNANATVNANANANANVNGNPNRRSYDDRPPSSRPNGGFNNQANQQVNSQLDQKHQQEIEQLHNRQDQERQKLEQQQLAERNKVSQNNSNTQQVQQINQKHEQQLQQLEQKHDSERQQLQNKQSQERQKNDNPKNDKSGKQEHGGR